MLDGFCYWNFLSLNYFGEDVEWILLIPKMLYIFRIFVQVILGFVFYILRMNLMFIKLSYRVILNLNLRKWIGSFRSGLGHPWLKRIGFGVEIENLFESQIGFELTVKNRILGLGRPWPASTRSAPFDPEYIYMYIYKYIYFKYKWKRKKETLC